MLPSRMLEFALARQFRTILRWAAAGSALCVGCDPGGSSESDTPAGALEPGLAPTEQTGDPLVSHCDGLLWQPLRGFNPALRWDYVSMRKPSSNPAFGPALLQEVGEPCASAKQRDECFEEFGRSSSGHRIPFLLATRGDEVRAFDGPDARLFFGEIDGADEALWLALSLDVSFNPCAPDTELMRLDNGTIQVEGTLPASAAACSFGQQKLLSMRYQVTPDGNIDRHTDDMSCVVGGRRPAGLCDAPSRSPDETLGPLLAREAHGEAASVWAFAQLERELQAHMAPHALADGARRARFEEAHHARAMGALARRYGGRPRVPRVSSQPLRSLAELAEDNAAEGCVRETYAALRVAYQLRHAHDRVGARVFARLAVDELRHAAWSWQLAHWAEPRLSVNERRRVRAARRDALHGLVHELDHGYGLRTQLLLGYPSHSAAERLISGLAVLVNELSA